MDYQRLEALNQQLLTKEGKDINMQEMLDEIMDLFSKTVLLSKKEQIVSERFFWKKFLCNNKIQDNIYGSYKYAVAAIVASIIATSVSLDETITLLKKNINEENYEVFEKIFNVQDIELPAIEKYVSEYCKWMRKENRNEKIIKYLSNEIMLTDEEKCFLVGSGRNTREEITEKIEREFIARPQKFISFLQDKIAKQDYMDINKYVYRYLEITSDFDTELIYMILEFYLNAKILRPVDEILKLYINRFRCVPFLEMNILLYLMDKIKDVNKSEMYLQTYLRAAKIYAEKRPNDIGVNIVYFSKMSIYRPANFYDELFSYLPLVDKGEKLNTFFSQLELGKEQFLELTTHNLKLTYSRLVRKNKVLDVKYKEIYKILRDGNKEEAINWIDEMSKFKCTRDELIERILLVLRVSRHSKDKAVLESCTALVEEALNKKIYFKSRHGKIDAYYQRALYYLGNKEAKVKIDLLSKFEPLAYSIRSEIEFEEDFQHGNFDACYEDLYRITSLTSLIEKIVTLKQQKSDFDYSELDYAVARKYIVKIGDIVGKEKIKYTCNMAELNRLAELKKDLCIDSYNRRKNIVMYHAVGDVVLQSKVECKIFKDEAVIVRARGKKEEVYQIFKTIE